MLTPRKHLNLDASLLRIAAIMLRELKKHGAVDFERLRQVVYRRIGPDSEPVFFAALNFLFLLGKVDYHLKNDSIEFKAS